MRSTERALGPRGLGQRVWACQAVLCLTLFLPVHGGLGAQEQATIAPGARLRITAPSLGLRVSAGTVRDVRADAYVVLLDQPRAVVTVPRDSITALDVAIATERRIKRGLGWGLLAGMTSGIVLGLATAADDQSVFRFDEAAHARGRAFAGGVILGLAGGVVGLIAGSRAHDVWAPVAPDRATLAFAPALGLDRFGVALQLRHGARW